MKSKLTFFLLLTFCYHSAAAKESMTSFNYDNGKMDSIGNSIIANQQVMGFAVAIMQGSDTLYSRGFGFTDSLRQNPVTHETRFLMASISKLVGSTMIMKLTEEGMLSPDQTLYELLPEYPNSEQAKKITLRQMLSHTSGLADYAPVIDSMYVKTGQDPTDEDFLNFFKDQPLLFEPGTNYHYSNSGYILMAMIVENMTGNDWQTEVDRIVNRPTGLNLKLIKEVADTPNMSTYFTPKDSTFLPYAHWTWIRGDGGLTATPTMLATFCQKWANGEIISRESIRTMSTPMVLKDGITTGYGMGVRNGSLNGKPVIGHSGGHFSNYSMMMHFPGDNITITVQMNTDKTSFNARSILSRFAWSFFGWEQPDYSLREVTNENLSKYVGEYATFDHKMDNIIFVNKQENGKLCYQYKDSCYAMTYLGENTFWISRWPYDHVVFHVDAEGESRAVKEYFTGFYTVLRKRVKR